MQGDFARKIFLVNFVSKRMKIRTDELLLSLVLLIIKSQICREYEESGHEKS